jgi:hypothetical protein
VFGDGPVYPTQENIVLFKMLVDEIKLSSHRRSISMVLLHIYLMINSIKYINECQLCSIFILLTSSMTHYFLFPLSSSRHTYALRNHLYTLVFRLKTTCARENIFTKVSFIEWIEIQQRLQCTLYVLECPFILPIGYYIIV